MSDIGTFSFYPGKNLGATGEGGAIITNNKKLDQKVKELRNWSQPKRYFHNDISYNYRMDTIQAAALNVKIKHLKEWTLKRRSIASEYQSRLKNTKLNFLTKDQIIFMFITYLVYFAK